MSALKQEKFAEEPDKTVSPPSDENAIRAARRAELSMEICEGMIDIAAAMFNVSSKALRSPHKTPTHISRVRQVAMYVSHVALGLNMNEIGRGFGRNRTTVTHSCHLVEDMRDDIEFDRVVVMVERVALVAFRNRMEQLR